MWKNIHRGNSEVQTGLSLSKLQLFTHKAYCAIMYFSLWLPESDMVSVEVSNSMFHHHCLLLSHDYSKQIYTNCVILCFKCYVLWEKPKKIIECAITGHYCHCWKVLNHDITTFPATECDRSRQRAERSLLSNLDPRVWHLVTPKDMFSSSHWLSWWNICSVVNGVIVASHSCGLITVKFIDLCSSMTWFIFTVQQCECVSARVCKSGRHRWFYLFFPSYTSFFFTAQNSSSLSWQKFLESLSDTFCGAPVHRHSTITPTHLLSRAINWEK